VHHGHALPHVRFHHMQAPAMHVHA
jgi:hypothetical protein